VVIGIEQNKPQAIAAMTKAASAFPNIRNSRSAGAVSDGSERHLVQAITGIETPARKLTADLGIVVAQRFPLPAPCTTPVRFGRPLVARVVTVSGGAIRNPGNVLTPIAHVSPTCEFCGGFSSRPRAWSTADR